MLCLKHLSTAVLAAAVFTGSMQASETDRLEGVWKSVGYGSIVAFENGSMRQYHITDISCTRGEEHSRDETSLMVNRVDLTERDRLSFYIHAGLTRYDFIRLPALPENCTAEQNPDPEYNFEVFWRVFNDHYAFFDLHQVDWGAVYGEYRPKVTKETTPEELFKIFSDMQALLNDGHVGLETPFGEFNALEPGTLSRLVQKVQAEKPMPDVYSLQAAKTIKDIIADRYLKGTKKSALNKDNITWGWVAGEIGYISIDSMHTKVPDDPSGFKMRDLVDEVMDRALTDLAGASGLIVDARWNGGGYDEFALAIAGHLTDRNLMAFTKRSRVGDRFAPKQQVFIPTHARKKYTGPIVFLCGRDSLSAAEIFAMAMQAIPTVTSMGERTNGILSDILDFPLPNGWHIGLSNELYIASDGGAYEGIGIPVDIDIPKHEGDTLESFIMRGMDTAIAFLQEQ